MRSWASGTGDFEIGMEILQHAFCVCPVGSVDFCVDWEVRISGGEDAVMGVGQDGGQGGEAGALWPVEHLGLKLGELVLEVRESLWQSFDNAGVNRVKHPLLRGTEVLGSLQS